MKIVGYEDKVDLFKKLVELGELRHAYLFFGDRQIGKSLFAKNLAHFLERGEFGAGLSNAPPFIDSLFISAPRGKTIGIDEVRKLKSFLWQTPLNSPKRLAVIDDAEKLTSEAQSALLKIVEEPPAHGLIIFIAHDSQALFPPLVSRLTKVYFGRLTENSVRAFLENQGLNKADALRIARKSFGRIGRAMLLAHGKKEETEDNLEAELQELIMDLWFKGPERYSRELAWLLEREVALKRYNLNQNLQRRAILEKLNA